jgi:formate hydrogenlyase subunit 3/multisubunit Na+/H+ antiporter MnhD subunit
MHLSPMSAIAGAMILLTAGAIVSLLLSANRRIAGWFSFIITAAAGGLTLWASALTILHGPGEAISFGAITFWGSVLRFYVDGLSALFMGLIAVVSILAALYSVSYMDHYRDYHVGRYYPWFLLFIAGMYGIVTITDTMFFFCAFWQLMTIPSFALIRFENRKPENVRAANKYLWMMELACLCIMAGSAALVFMGPAFAHTAGMFDFDTLREHIHVAGISMHALGIALLLMLIGFGIKAGMWPFGFAWLPDAHPAAPSPVSALLSGVMIKTGVYGIIRTFFWLVPDITLDAFTPVLWGAALAVIGTITLVTGTFQALKQEQSKRLLAFHSIGQVGYIILGLGAALMLLPGGPATLATVAMIGALFHTVNHAFFKSLLFFNAGAVLKATDTQDLNKLGGLAALMPVTAVTCLIASFSIAGVPLFNGFASKWSIYTATILGGKDIGILAICGLFGILTSALTLASFMKFFGVTFLSRESEIVKKQVKAGVRLEAGILMQLPQVLLAFACVVLGLVPALGYALLDRSLASGPAGIAQLLPRIQVTRENMITGLAPGGEAALFVPLVIAGVIALLMALAYAISKLGGAPRKKADIWLCGYDLEADIHRYGAHNLYGEVKHLFDRKHRRKAG